MFIDFNYFTISLLLGGFMAFFSGLVVLLNDRSKSENQTWFAMTVSTSIWSFAYFFMTVTVDKSSARVANLILHDAAIFIPLFYLLLVLIITNKVNKYRIVFYIFSVVSILFLFVNPSSDFVKDLVPKAGFNFAQVPGPLYIYYFLYFSILVSFGVIVSILSIIESKDRVQKIRYKYVIYFSVAASIGGGSVFATTFFGIPPYPLILFSLYPVITGYAILRHQLFNVKIIATQLITFILWVSIFVRMMFSTSVKEQFADGILFLISIVLGLFLIKSVKNEVKNREQIEALAKELEGANEHLKELDQQKSEFVSMASHQIRGPLAAMRGYASMLLEGDFGPMEPGVKDSVDKIYQSTKDLVVLVGDYLDVSRIEQGRMKYEFTQFDLKETVSTLITEYKPNFDKAKLTVSFDFDPGEYFVDADQGKIKQVIGNLIDNSIKYTPTGGIHLWLKRKGADKIQICISDTGVGIDPAVLPRLFEKFTRAPDASKTNIIGTGLGLYVARKMIEAHNGRVWAESAGQGKGSTFFIELKALHPVAVV